MCVCTPQCAIRGNVHCENLGITVAVCRFPRSQHSSISQEGVDGSPKGPKLQIPESLPVCAHSLNLPFGCWVCCVCLLPFHCFFHESHWDTDTCRVRRTLVFHRPDETLASDTHTHKSNIATLVTASGVLGQTVAFLLS